MAHRGSVKISLNEHDFRRLVHGEALTVHSGEGPAVEISLSNIGFGTMKKAIGEAELRSAGEELGILI